MIIIPHLHLLRLGLAWCGFCAGSTARWDAAGPCCVPPVARPASAWGPGVVCSTHLSRPEARHPLLALGGGPMSTRAAVTTRRVHDARARARRATLRHSLACAPRRTAHAEAQAHPTRWMALGHLVAREVPNGTRAVGARPHGSAAHV